MEGTKLKQRILSFALVLCLCISSRSVTHASQENDLPPDDVMTEEATAELPASDNTIPTPAKVYEAMTALENEDAYKEGTTWNDNEPYSDSAGCYRWNGGTLDGTNISAVGCVAFAFILSDAAFGNLQARMYGAGDFSYEDIKVGDILRVNNDIHTVIVLEVSDAGVVVAEGNYSGTVHWRRTISRDEVMSSSSHYITRYPENYIPPDDPTAGEIIENGTLDGGLTWELTRSGVMTVSGSGAMPDFGGAGDQPWNSCSSQIRKVIIGDGITRIGSCAFQGCGVLDAELPSSVTSIGNHAFRQSSIISVTIPSGVTTIGDSAFRQCAGLSSISISQGVETLGPSAFYGCTSLTSIALPASISEVGDAAFFQCTKLERATFEAGSKQVTSGDNIFTKCYYLMQVTLPQSMDRIGTGMFQDCLMLPGVEIPQGVESIGDTAFASCSAMTVVLIPDSVTTIGSAAFADCPLTDIYYTGSEAQWNSISKIGDTASAVSKATIHYEYSPTPAPTPTPDPNPDPSPTTEPDHNLDPAPTTEPDHSPDPSPTAEPEHNPNPAPTAEPDHNPGQTPNQPEAPAEPPSQDSIPTPAPMQDTQVPVISGTSKKGWEAVKEKAGNASEGEWVNVNMNGAGTVPGSVINSVKGKNITFSFDMGNGITWTVNGLNITTDHANDVNLSVQTKTSGIPQNIVDSIAEGCQTMQLSLAHSGDFGYSAVLVINMEAANADLYANLFYYNKNADRLEFTAVSQINEDGIAELTFTHASDYVIVISDNIMDNGISQNAGVQSPKTGEFDIPVKGFNDVELPDKENSRNFIWWPLVGVIITTAAGTIALLLYKKVYRKN